MDNIHVTSSEIGEFVYCPRAWWLRQNRSVITTPQMLRGTATHNRLSFQLDALSVRKIIIAVLILLILILFAVLVITSYLTKL
jgi:hypothetical protein